MRLSPATVALALAPAAAVVALDGFGVGMPHQIRLWQALLEHEDDSSVAAVLLEPTDQHTFASPAKKPAFDAHCFDQPVSHFALPHEPHANDTFCQRYWFDSSSYKKGGPVFVLDGGETSGANRLPFLETGIVKRLAQEFNGLAIILEHRYYGHSFPYYPDGNLSTDSLRFLSNAEALEDSAVFIRDLKIKGLGHDVRGGREGGPKWIYIGGSYAGARAAHMRVLYPDRVFGAIASSAVTHAQVFYPEYMDAIRQWAPQDCMADLQSAILTIDAHLDDGGAGRDAIKALFGLDELADDDFAGVLSNPLGNWQARNWDPAVGSLKFYDFCAALTNRSSAASADDSDGRKREVVGNYAGWIREHEVKRCPGWEKKGGVERCFGTTDDEKFQDISLKQTWRAWLFQVCTEWGYLQGAPLEGPRIVSNRLTLDYTSKICRQGFPRGNFVELPTWPNVTVVNALGDFAIAADRLAFIDGDSDPWRPATPGSDTAPKRADTLLQPSKIIPDAVHHFDENGLADPTKEPARIQKIHGEELEFVKFWLESA